MTAMANTITDRMDPVLDLLNQRPREDWSWNFEPDTLGHSAVNAVALCNAALLTYSDSASVRRFLSKWQFADVRILRGFHTQGFIARQGNTLIVAFRGTEPINACDWLTNVNYHQRELLPDVPGLVHQGFACALEEVKEAMVNAVAELSSVGVTQTFITGHSLGGALAVLAASILQGRQKIAAVYTFGQPRVGDLRFSMAFDAKLGNVTFRYVNDRDIVPHLPPAKLPARPVLSAPASVIDSLRSLSQIPSAVREALMAVSEGETFAHVGHLKLFLQDGRLTDDEKLWREREVLYSGTIDNLIRSGSDLFRVAVSKVLDADRRILDHDPLNGYLPKLERQLRSG
jgi:pimeloyl-ACP methyl ester carboxylesterase